jgi:hypothetical protein
LSGSNPEHTNKLIRKFIDTHSITYEQFNALPTIVSSQYIDDCLTQNAQLDSQPYNAGLLFNLYLQGDRSVYFQAPKPQKFKPKR